ncbi:MAG: excinuclease ABC subunit UvrC [Armatimonadota bacterium]|nr:excinuclease ABC subunit UvrC [Armatimonadota bacterium]
METVQAILRLLPPRPGVYLFKDASGRVLYVGKAASLRARVRQYFQNPDAQANPRLRLFVPKIADIDTIVTANEVEALILETNLIKQHQPPYNIRMADDKAYPYLKLTHEPFPKIVMTRKVVRDGARYFGPYPYHEPKIIGRTIRTIRRLFRLRTCAIEITRDLPRPCLDYDMGLCSAPCVAWGASADDYAAQVRQAALFLEGRQAHLLDELRAEMTAAAAAMQFERAAQLRDQIQAMEAVNERQRIATTGLEDRDIAAIAQSGDLACVEIITIRAGRIQDQQHVMVSGTRGADAGEVLSQALARHYADLPALPREVLTDVELPDRAVLGEWLTRRRGTRVEVLVPQRGEKRRLVDLARENALLYLNQTRARDVGGPAGVGVAELQEALGLEAPPFRIEAYDVSHFQAGEAVGSLVVFEGGLARRADYRQFRIRGDAGNDDYASLQEMLRRRFARARQEQEKLDAGEPVRPRWSVLPDLILIDGGRGQLNAAREVLFEHNVAVPAAGLAKAQEEIFLADRPEPVRLPVDSQALHLVQRLRDEAHRFANTAGRRLRERRIVFSVLDDIPGIGERRKRELIRRFGSVRGVRAASLEALTEVLGARLAARVAAHLAEHPESRPTQGGGAGTQARAGDA